MVMRWSSVVSGSVVGVSDRARMVPVGVPIEMADLVPPMSKPRRMGWFFVVFMGR